MYSGFGHKTAINQYLVYFDNKILSSFRNSFSGLLQMVQIIDISTEWNLWKIVNSTVPTSGNRNRIQTSEPAVLVLDCGSILPYKNSKKFFACFYYY